MPGVASTRPIGSLPEETTQDACGGDVSTNSSTDLGSAEVQAATETPQARDIRDLCIGIDPRSGRRLPHLVAIARPGGGPAGPRSFNLYGQQDAISDSDAVVPAEELDRGRHERLDLHNALRCATGRMAHPAIGGNGYSPLCMSARTAAPQARKRTATADLGRPTSFFPGRYSDPQQPASAAARTAPVPHAE
jgi:hypothetical protein